MDLKAVEVRTHGDNYVVQAWNKGTSTSMDLEKHCGPEDLKKLEIDGRAKRKAFSGPPNLLSLSQVYEPCPVDRKVHGEAQTTVIEEVCVHIYKQRKKMATAQDKNSHRPFVSVNNPS